LVLKQKIKKYGYNYKAKALK